MKSDFFIRTRSLAMTAAALPALALPLYAGTINIARENSLSISEAVSSIPQDTTRRTTAIPGRQSWLSDRRDFKIGDIVTILVDEHTLTSLNKRVDATDSRRRDLNVGVRTPNRSTSVSAGGSNSSTSQNRGTDSRTNRVLTELSARVTEVGENGLMKLEGTKSMIVEESRIQMEISGWARVEDVRHNNTIQSFQLADTQLTYDADGPLASSKRGIFSRLLSKLWP